eukprot:Anaeramoba_ignava/c21466_g1_i1.p2 GENE.c21466_g1_i1~~c21466_g1_i1.p2  ORF type:complete len:329 (-),score=94.00 c21466_g1_i1:22-1008(-)
MKKMIEQGTGIGVNHNFSKRVVEEVLEINDLVVKTKDGRLPGIMHTIHWKDPNIWAFLELKNSTSLKNPILSRSNHSVVVNNFEEFISSPVSLSVAEAAHARGDPGIIFSNNDTQAAAPCGELWLDPYEACLLGNINLLAHISYSQIDWDELANTARKSAIFLDSMIEKMIVPEQMIDVIMKNRRLGLGVMGFASVLEILGIPYESDEAVEIAEKMSRIISSEARNVLPDSIGITALAPTGRTALKVGVSHSIEPLSPLEVSPEGHLKILAAWQKYVDGAISKTVIIPFETDSKEILTIIKKAYQLGCKSVTLYREGSAGHKCERCLN